MNNWNTSPIGQTNEVARQCTPKQTENESNDEAKQPATNYKYLLADDLQKIRRSNHSSHHRHRREIMDDDEHDGIIKGMLYPGLEDVEDYFDFFEEDYDAAQAAVSSNMDTGEEQQASPSGVAAASHNNAYNQPPRLEDPDSYYSSYFSSMGTPYSDLSNQKLR